MSDITEGLAQYPSVICAWCDKTIGTAPVRPLMVSHGICPDCDATLLQESGFESALEKLEPK